MYKKTTIYLISALLTFQVSNAAVVPRDATDDATELLDQLRSVARDALTVAFNDHISISMAVDATAQAMKANAANGILVQCVNDQSRETLYFIYFAAIDVTANSLMRIFEDEKQIVACLASADANCFDNIINKLTGEIGFLPAVIANQVQSDHHNIQGRISLITACWFLGGNSQKAVAPSSRDASNDAQTALNRLRQVVITNIIRAFQDYISISNVVDTTAREVKIIGMAVEGVAECVDAYADEAIDMIYVAMITVAKNFLMPVYDAEAELIACGLSNEDCINAILKDLLDDIDSTPGDVNTEVQIDSMAVDQRVSAMRACRTPT